MVKIVRFRILDYPVSKYRCDLGNDHYIISPTRDCFHCYVVIVSPRPVSGVSGDSVTGVYSVYGAVVGHTSLTASVTLPSGQVIYSNPRPLEVFPPLRLEPKNITLIIGATLQVMMCRHFCRHQCCRNSYRVENELAYIHCGSKPFKCHIFF